jgi:hypothetical protein
MIDIFDASLKALLTFLGVAWITNVIKILKDSPAIFEVSCFATHFCLIHNASYTKILNNYPESIEDYKDQIDVYYGYNLRIWTTTPFFAKQRPSKSDIEEGIKDYTELFNDSEKKLLALT